MDCIPAFLPYHQTGYFSNIILDYVSGHPSIQPFFSYPPSHQGIKQAIAARSSFVTNRSLLVQELTKQYQGIQPVEIVQHNIALLSKETTFTICTAHQPNIFTGHLYFVYKVLHTVALSADLKKQYPAYDFVPVFYMGSEDADLEELGHVFIGGEKLVWPTTQTGAVGRMIVDKALVQLIDTIQGQVAVQPFGNDIISLLKDCYKVGTTIEQATFRLVHGLFGEYGVVTLLPDNALLKASFASIIEKELFTGFSHPAVQQTVTTFPQGYKVQASGRELNMFYLLDKQRERFEQEGTTWRVLNTELSFTEAELKTELQLHPERFSPNVILRPVFQEWLLPNIAFIGGGGEIAYWLQLKKVFEAVAVPYPVLVLRNSFMFIPKAIALLSEKLAIGYPDLFKSTADLINYLVKRDSSLQLGLEIEQQQLGEWYDTVGEIAGKTHPSLQQHTDALKTQALKKIKALEKKMLRAEKEKFEAQQRQVKKITAALFPNNNLQERVDNLVPYFSIYGKDFIRKIYEHSRALQPEFVILSEQ